MKRMFAALLSLALLAALLSGCAGREPVSSGKAGGFSIVATSFPAYDLARAVCGQEAEITLLLPPGAESHSYEPTPRDILAVEDCGLFLYLGGESDAWVETILSSLDAPAETLRMIDCVETLEEETLEGMTAQGHSHDDQLAYHPWPAYEEAKCVEQTIEIAVQVNGKVKARIKVAADIDNAAAIAAAKAEPAVAEFIAGKTVAKEIYVKGKLVNIAVKG